MKTTVDIADALFARAKRHAQRTGRPMRALIEQGLQLALLQEEQMERYELPSCAVGDAADPDPLEAMSWQDLREHIYGAR